MSTALDHPSMSTPTTVGPVGPVGTVQTFLEPGRAVVWLTGEIDLAVDPVLAQLAAHLHLFAPHVVLEVSQMTFCDSTVAAFVADVSRRIPVTVLRPPATFLDLLKVCGLTDRIQVANFPGPALARPL